MSRADYERGWEAGARAMRSDAVHALRDADPADDDVAADLVASLPLPQPSDPEARR